MPRLKPKFVSEQESKKLASKQMLSFLTLPDTEAEPPPHVRPPSGQSLFSLDALPPEAIGGPALFNWTSRDIYDVDHLLLFRDQTIDLGSGFEWRVRIAASDLLRTPVWSVEVGPALNVEALMAEALAELHNKTDFEPLLVNGEEDVRLVCYSYPKLGILCYSRTNPDAKFVIKLKDLIIIPLNPDEPPETPESVYAVWSPYDIVVRSTIVHFRRLWKRNMELLPALPETFEELTEAIMQARKSIEEEKVVTPRLELEGQATPFFCAAATARMILRQHGISKTQNELADAMEIDGDGAKPEEQVNGLNNSVLTAGPLRAEPDSSPSFIEAQEELRLDRPFKTGSSYHARAVGGFRVEREVKEMLYIYDPDPPNQGKIYCEDWNAIYHYDFMYVRPPKF